MMFVHQTQLEGKVKEIIEEPLLSIGYELVKVRLKGAGRDRTLLIMLDRADGVPINIDDCQKASQSISVLLDVEDPIEGKYSLEVSSPGVSRPLTRHKDFVNHINSKIKVITKQSVEGRKSIYGVLNQVTEANIEVEDKELKQTFTINFDNIMESHLYVDFGRGSDEKKGKQGIGINMAQSSKAGEDAPRRKEGRAYDAPKRERDEYPRRRDDRDFKKKRGDFEDRPRGDSSGNSRNFRKGREEFSSREDREYPRRRDDRDFKKKSGDFEDRRRGDSSGNSKNFRKNREEFSPREDREYPRRRDDRDFKKKSGDFEDRRRGDSSGNSKNFRKNREEFSPREDREYPRRKDDRDFKKKRDNFEDKRDNRGSSYSREEGGSRRSRDEFPKKEKRDFTRKRSSSDFKGEMEAAVPGSGVSRGYRPREEGDKRRAYAFEDTGGRKESGRSNEGRRRSFDDNSGYDRERRNFGERSSFKARKGNYNNKRKGS